MLSALSDPTIEIRRLFECVPCTVSDVIAPFWASVRDASALELVYVTNIQLSRCWKTFEDDLESVGCRVALKLDLLNNVVASL